MSYTDLFFLGGLAFRTCTSSSTASTLTKNLMNDSFIGDSAVKAAHAINIECGWELPEDIHEAHEKEITETC